MARFLIMSAVAGCVLCAPARAADADWEACAQTVDPARSIAGCTAVLGRGARESVQNRAIAHFNRGNIYGMQNQLDRAIVDYNQAVRLNSRFAQAFLNRAKAFQLKGDLANMAKDLGKALEIDPQLAAQAQAQAQTGQSNVSDAAANANAQQIVQRGFGLMQRSEYDRALADFEAAIRAAPRYGFGYVGRGLIMLQKEELDRAFADFDQALRLDSSLALAYAGRGYALALKDDYDRALPDLDEALRRDQNLHFANLGRGIAFLGQGDVDKAEDEFDHVLRQDANNAAAYAGRGFILKMKGAFDRALADFDAAVQRDPTHKMAMTNRGVIYGQRGDLDRAMREYEAVLRLDPRDPTAIAYRGMAYARKGDLGRGLLDVEAALRVRPKDRKILAAIYGVRGLMRSQSGDVDKAIEDYGQAIRTNPRFADGFLARAIAWSQKGDHDKAIADYSEAIRLAPAFVASIPVRGYAHGGKGTSERAVADWDEAIALNLKAAALNGRGYSYVKTGDAQKALTDLDEALRLNPQFADAYDSRAAAHAAAGDDGQALFDYETALRYDPSLKSASEGRDALLKAFSPSEPAPKVAPQPPQPQRRQEATPVVGALNVPPQETQKLEEQRLGGRRLALVIGVDGYKNISKLQAALNDARAVAETLGGLGFKVVKGENLDYQGMSLKILELERLIEPGDSVFFFFAGHGFATDGRNYLLPSDAPSIEKGQEALLENVAFPADRLLSRMQRRGARTAVFVLDACRNNPFEEASRGRSAIPETRGLSRMEPPEGAFVLFSAATGQIALDRLGKDDKDPNSVFTRVLIDEIKRDGATMLEIAKETQKRVRDLARNAGGEQRPAYYDEIVGQFVLKP